MKTNRALAFFAALLAGSCISAGVANAAGQAAPGIGHWRPGTNYQLLASPQPPTVGGDKVEVDEVFWYGCAHCYALDPTLEEWKTAKPPYVEFVRIPVIWGQVQRQHAKLYYTLQALNRLDLHPKMFDAIHKLGVALAGRDDVQARAMQRSFLLTQGIPEKDFDAAYDSMSVASNMLRAEEYSRKYAIASVPTVIVNGKFSTSVAEAGGNAQLISLINDLAASEKRR